MAKRFTVNSDPQQDQSHTEFSRGDRTHEGRIKAQGASAPVARCLACGQPEQLVWVHGHGQCTHCRMNVMPCCDGAVYGSGE